MRRTRTRLVIRGDLATPETIAGAFTLHAARNTRKYGVRSAAISTEFRVGNGKSALAVTNSDRVLGGASYRLRADAAERAQHGARCTDNNAQYAAFDPTSPRARVTDA